MIDVTEVIKTLPEKRRQRYAQLAMHGALLVLSIYTLIAHALWGAVAVAAPPRRERVKTGSVHSAHERG